VYNISVGKRKRKRPLGRPRRRWDDNITTDPGEIGWEVVNGIHLDQDGPVAGCYEHGNELSRTMKDGKFLD